MAQLLDAAILRKLWAAFYILIAGLFAVLLSASISMAQQGLGKLDVNGKRDFQPVVQRAITPSSDDTAWYFRLPGGACHRDDCGSDRERSQLIQSRPDNETGESYRYTVSFFLPENFQDVSPANTLLWEVKPFGQGKPSIILEIINSGLQFSMSDPTVAQRNKMRPERPAIIQAMGRIPRGRWTDVVVDVRWSSSSDGVLRVFHNGRQIVNHGGPNVEPSVRRQAVMFGIYRSFISRYQSRNGVDVLPTQEAYFGNVTRQRIRFQ